MKAFHLIWMVILFLAGSSAAPAQMVFISQDGATADLSWEGEGVLQVAPDITGPWMDDVTATSPHLVLITGTQQWFRVFYPNGFQPVFEPPGLAFAEPNALPSVLGHELGHALGSGHSFRPEINDEVLCHSGETRRTEVDLHIRGRGMDFIWARHYRSRHGPDSAQGNRWVFSYDVRIEKVGAHVRVFDGSGRADVFVHQPDGSYVANQFFREGRFDSNGVFRLTFADTGVWEFLPLGAQPAAGRISKVADRNNNELTFDYDPLGRLTNVTDTLNRNIQVAYNPDGFIASVTDFEGREVRYEYYQDFEVGGSFGDLKSARSPIVTGTPTLNDFPGGKTNRYAYSEGFADDRENHLLLSVTDPKGQTSHEYVYQHNQSDLAFLRCLTRRLGYSSNWIHFHYVAQTPEPSNQLAVWKVIVNDRMGNVSEQFYDAGNRVVMLREYTGRADPNQPTTETLNRPLNPLRTNDPPFFQTAWEWNEDSLPTRVLFPNGNSVSNVYELTLNPTALRRARGNLRERHRFPGPLGGDQTVISQYWTYDPRFGTDARHNPWFTSSRGFGFVEMAVDGSGDTTFFAYDSHGNCTNVIHRIATITEDFEYNAFGQLTAYVSPDNGSGFRRRDQYLYYTGGPQMGYLQQHVADSGSGGFNQTTTYTYDAVGNILSITDPRGHDSLFTYNALDQLVHSESRETSISGGTPFRQTTDCFYDANDNLVRVCEGNADELGLPDPANGYITRLMEYDILDRLVRVCAESGSYDVPRVPPKLDCSGLPASEFITTEYEYDANGNPALMRLGEASEGRQPANTVRCLYDERDLLFRTIRAEGDSSQSSTQWDYDPNVNPTVIYAGLESVPRLTAYVYDGFNRLTQTTDPMGNIFTVHFNPDGVPLRARVEGETSDMPGSVGNVRLAEVTNVFDAMDRLTRRDVAFFDTTTGLPIDDGLATTQFTYSDSSQLMTRTDDNNHTSSYSYDRLHRLLRGRDARSNEVFYSYDANSNPIDVSSVEKSDLGNPDQTFATHFVYDARDRLIQMFDNISNSVEYAYDSRNNRVLTTDQLGVQTRLLYDGQSRQISVTKDMNATGPSPSDPMDIVVSNVWDDSFRLVAQVDDSSNVTSYVYDALNRRIREVLADGTDSTNTYDVHDNLVIRRDANSNVVSASYDLLNRLTNWTVVPGMGVCSNTTFEAFRHDGLSRVVRAEDDDSLVELAYNSLGSVLSHTLNGKTTSASYDGLGNTLQCIYPGGRVVGYLYDPLNRISAGLDASNNVLSTYDFIGPDRMERMDYPNGTRIECEYDGITGVPNPSGDFGVKQRIRTLHTNLTTAQIIDDRAYTWDPRHSKTSRLDQRALGPALRHDYAYDAADRMVAAQVTAPPAMLMRDTHYVLDGVGNRMVVTNDSVGEFYTMDSTSPVPADFQVNQYTTTSLGPRTYDENGNLTALNPGGRNEFWLTFDYANRLVRFTDPVNGFTNEYSYDALGRRIEKVVVESNLPPQVTRYFYGADWFSHANALQVVEEQDGLGTTLATYMYGGGLNDVMNMQRGGNDYQFHHDDLGNVMAVTDGTGTVVERYEYGDFGEPMFFDGTGTSRTGSAIGNPYLFTGGRYDEETGFYYFRSRYLDPYSGRFITRDPLGTWGDPANAGNGLTYVGNNPWTHTDPMGLAKEKFVRDKPHVNIGTIGHVDSGAPSFNETKGKARALFNRARNRASHKRKQSLYFPESMLVEIQHEASGHAHGHLDYLKKVGDPATSQANRRYLYFAKTADGPMPQAREHILLARQVGVPVIVVYLNKVDLVDDEDLLEPIAPSSAHIQPSQVKVLQMGFNPASSDGDTATHEVGHWFVLHHTFDARTKAIKFPIENGIQLASFLPATTFRVPYQFTTVPAASTAGREDSIMVIGWSHEVVSPRDSASSQMSWNGSVIIAPHSAQFEVNGSMIFATPSD